MAEIILHHYPTSPFSEKVRIALGLKGVSWRSVVIPVIMPKPDLMPLTGGYRKTPVMQIGADIFCDTQCILREIERRFPEPTLYPKGSEGLDEALAYWADRSLFQVSVGAVFATIGDKVPEAFKQDRAKFSGRDFNPERMRAALPLLLDQLRAYLDWIESALADGRRFLHGEQAALADLAVYHCVWFIARNLGADFGPLKHLQLLREWSGRIAAIGHGQVSELDAKEALAIARAATPAARTATDAQDPAGRTPGLRVSVTPDDTGRDPVTGELIASSAQEIVIRRSDPAVGEMMVHFPRAGFVVAPAPAE